MTLKKAKNVKHSIFVLFQSIAFVRPQGYFGILHGLGKASSIPKASNPILDVLTDPTLRFGSCVNHSPWNSNHQQAALSIQKQWSICTLQESPELTCYLSRDIHSQPCRDLCRKEKIWGIWPSEMPRVSKGKLTCPEPTHEPSAMLDAGSFNTSPHLFLRQGQQYFSVFLMKK